MKVTTNNQAPFTPRTLGNNNPTPPGGGPEDPKKNGSPFFDNFVSNVGENGSKFSQTLMPFSFLFVGSRLGGTVGGAVGGQAGQLIGSIAGGYVGMKYGRQNIQPHAESFLDKITPDNKYAAAAVSTAYAAAIGGITLSLGLGGLAPGPIALGAGLTAAGVLGYSAWQAK